MVGAIIYLSKVYDSTQFELLLSKKEMSDLTGMTKESATRILNDFVDEGIITLESGFLIIINSKKLEEISMHG
jgi:CRP/FNR family transcriptional regulator